MLVVVDEIEQDDKLNDNVGDNLGGNEISAMIVKGATIETERTVLLTQDQFHDGTRWYTQIGAHLTETPTSSSFLRQCETSELKAKNSNLSQTRVRRRSGVWSRVIGHTRREEC